MVRNFIKLADIVGFKPYVSTFENYRYKSTLGIIVGFLSIILILATSFFFFYNLFVRNEITLLYNEIKINTKTVNISNSPFLFTLNNARGKPIPKEYFEIRMNYWNYTLNDKDFVIN